MISYGITLSIQRYAVNLLVVVQVGDSKQDGRHDVLDLLLAELVGLLVLQVGEGSAVSELHHNLRMNLLNVRLPFYLIALHMLLLIYVRS